jgi:hypothetical protein
MGFVTKTWKDRITEYPTRRKLTKTDGSTETVTVERNEGTVSQEGDAFNAATMNDLESRIAEAIGYTLGAQAIESGATTAVISSDHITADSLIDIYFAEASKETVASAGVTYSQTAGSLTLTFGSALTAAVTISNVKVVNV